MMYVGLTSHDSPTADRWRSFGWQIAGAIDTVKLGSTELYRYSVTPCSYGPLGHIRFQFPLDMLRYDRAYPSTQRDAAVIADMMTWRRAEAVA